VLKVHNRPIKRPRKGSNKESLRNPKGTLVWRTGQCPVHQGTRSWTRYLRENGGRSAIIHRTVRCMHRTVSGGAPDCPVCQRSNDYFKSNGWLQRIECAPVRAEVRAHVVGAPDSLQEMSGAPPDSPEAPQVRAPTVEPQRLAVVAGAPDSVRWRTELFGVPCDSRLPTAKFWWLGL
jgi:hypothetical protein